ncbi:hypothetical protein Tdes44962_MAKER08050 [Teratosphaeria destructans]|uniref:Uncharacterized protein n=1 Tax=Teratosphaeria destructans TaxID=418781 RepID=A0A9W7SXT3_9PEZI|nr:hypothetical protein Tdes44962_MAKER08050 [Teratosphaeria destructans]
MPRDQEHSPQTNEGRSGSHQIRNSTHHERRSSEIRSPTKADRGRHRVTTRKPLTALHHGQNNDPGRGRYARKPLTPTTKLEILKERRHRAYERKRAEERRRAVLLGREETYWRVLRSGARYRSLGGARAG